MTDDVSTPENVIVVGFADDSTAYQALTTRKGSRAAAARRNLA